MNSKKPTPPTAHKREATPNPADEARAKVLAIIDELEASIRRRSGLLS